MDLALQFPLIKQGFRKANHQLTEFRQIADWRIRPQEKASSSSMGRFKKVSVYCKKKPSDERTSNQEEIISLLKRIQSSISKGGESQTVEKKKKNRDESSENEPPLSKAILDVLEKPRKNTEGDTSEKKAPKRQQSSFTKRYIRPSASDSIGKLPDKEMTEKEEKPPLIETMKLAELKEVAKNRGIKGYSKLKKSELLNLLKSS